MPLSPRKLSWAAYCDTCLVGSLVIACDDPNAARAFAIAKLELFGWTHLVPRDVVGAARVLADIEWRGETYCRECTARAAQQKRAG